MQILKGKLKEIGFLNLLQLIHDSGMTGKLRIRTPRGEATVTFSEGTPVSAYFGSLQGIEALQELTLFEEGTFDFETSPPDLTSPNLPQEGTDRLFVSLAFGADEYRKLLREIPLEAVPHLQPGLEDQELNLKGFHLRLITSFNGTSVEELAQKIGTSRYQMLSALKELKDLGIVGFREKEEPGDKAVLTPDEIAQIESELTTAIGPMAELILEEKMQAHGGTRMHFPRSKVRALLDDLAEEIPDPEDRSQFLTRLQKTLKIEG